MADGTRMHRNTDETRALREKIIDYAIERLDFDPAPLDGPLSHDQLQAAAGSTITEVGLGGDRALELFAEVLAPATISVDHPNFLSFIPAAPTEAATTFDLAVSASSIYGGSWMEGAGAVFAENQVLSWLAQECGLPETAGGVFVQGGTGGNLSALVTAREAAKAKLSGDSKPRWAVVVSSEAHSSLKAAARVMDIELIAATAGEDGKLGGAAADAACAEAEARGLTPFALVATSGTTNFGIVDHLDELAEVALARKLWFHVDGAYGLAGILSPAHRELFSGIEHADSFIVDPHKWLFAPFDACALVYREPALARAAHSQHGEYLQTLHETGDFNPADYAFQLSRRPRGLPLWFSLATHGVGAYREAVALNIDLAHKIAAEIKTRDYLELVREPELSVVVFERVGWSQKDYDDWSAKLLRSGFAFVVPSSHRGRPNARFAIVNPRTEMADLVQILESMR
jgi:L-2,4-diaminobutyrate decarboxylase